MLLAGPVVITEGGGGGGSGGGGGGSPRPGEDGEDREEKLLMSGLGEQVEDQKVTAVYFNAAFKVERVALYGLQDGRIFDFIERQTPTSGADRAFLSQLFRGLTKYEPFGSGSGTSVVPGAMRGQ